MSKDYFVYAAQNYSSDVRQILSQHSHDPNVMRQHWAEHVYLLSSVDRHGHDQVHKIGYTFVDPEQRLYQLNQQFYGGRRWLLRHSMYCNDSWKIERLLHTLFAEKHVTIRGCKEIFRLDYGDDVSWIKSLNYLDWLSIANSIFHLYKEKRYKKQ